jgi:hypothetical protein
MAQVVGYLKGKSAIHIALAYLGRRQNFVGQQFWARGYHVSTVGRDETTIRAYIQKQQEEDKRPDQLIAHRCDTHATLFPLTPTLRLSARLSTLTRSACAITVRPTGGKPARALPKAFSWLVGLGCRPLGWASDLLPSPL